MYICRTLNGLTRLQPLGPQIRQHSRSLDTDGEQGDRETATLRRRSVTHHNHNPIHHHQARSMAGAADARKGGDWEFDEFDDGSLSE